MPNSVQTPEKPRYAFVDLAKGLCIMLVVWHHVASTWGLDTYPLKLPLSTFRMPLYFFLSGLFFKSYAGFFDFCLRKINKLLIPFIFFFITTSCILAFILAHFHLRPSPGASVWYAFIWQEQFPNFPIWFLLGLFWTNLIFYSLTLVAKKIPQKYSNPCLICLSLMVGSIGYTLGRFEINLPLFIDTAMTAIPYFCAGHFAFRYTGLLKPNKLDKLNIPLAVLGFGLVFLFSRATVSYVENKFQLPIWSMYLCGLSGALAILLLSKAIGKIPLVSYFGRYSIMILVTHGWVQWAIIKILWECHIYWSKNVSLAFVFIVTMLLYLGLIPFMRRFMPHVTAQKDVFKVQSN